MSLRLAQAIAILAYAAYFALALSDSLSRPIQGHDRRLNAQQEFSVRDR